LRGIVAHVLRYGWLIFRVVWLETDVLCIGINEDQPYTKLDRVFSNVTDLDIHGWIKSLDLLTIIGDIQRFIVLNRISCLTLNETCIDLLDELLMMTPKLICLKLLDIKALPHISQQLININELKLIFWKLSQWTDNCQVIFDFLQNLPSIEKFQTNLDQSEDAFCINVQKIINRLINVNELIIRCEKYQTRIHTNILENKLIENQKELENCLISSYPKINKFKFINDKLYIQIQN
ncbi:unnamed protein product, partial [Didymodactylos carnosus]